MARATTTAGPTGLGVLEKPGSLQLKPVYAVFGDEEFLRTSAVAAIRRVVLGDGEDDFGVARFDGRTAALADVFDEVATLPLLGSRRLVIVQNADDFVSAHREPLERYVQKPHRSGVLVLVVQSWPSNTRLARMVAETGLAIDCKSPDERQLASWCRRWSEFRYGKRLTNDAAQLLLELIGNRLGQLDSELDKLAAFAGSRPEVTANDVDRLVASGRVETVWKIIDAAMAGDGASALRMLDELTSAGEQPLMIFGAFSSQLRKLARAFRLMAAGATARSSLPRVGVPPFFLDKAQAQLRHLGPSRLGHIFDWLTETDLGMKGDSALAVQHLLERLIVRVAMKP
jgi:DNA polymerase-3 subunit delta